MGTKTRRQLPHDLERGRRRFQTWRTQRKPGSRIPQPLWTMAVRLAKTHGVSRTSGALGLDYYSLKRQAETAAAPPPSSEPAAASSFMSPHTWTPPSSRAVASMTPSV